MYRQQQSEAEMLKQTEGSFLDTALGKGLLTEIQDQYKNAVRQGSANGLKRELTDEAKQASIQTANKQLTDSVRGVAGMGTNYRLGILNMVNALKGNAFASKWGGDANLAGLRMGFAEDKNQSALNLGENAGKFGSNLINTASGWEKLSSGNKDNGDKKVINGMNNNQLGQNDYDKLMKEQGTPIKFTEKSPPDFNMWGRW